MANIWSANDVAIFSLPAGGGFYWVTSVVLRLVCVGRARVCVLITACSPSVHICTLRFVVLMSRIRTCTPQPQLKKRCEADPPSTTEWRSAIFSSVLQVNSSETHMFPSGMSAKLFEVVQPPAADPTNVVCLYLMLVNCLLVFRDFFTRLLTNENLLHYSPCYLSMTFSE